MKLQTGKFALSGGIYFAICAAVLTMLSLMQIPGFLPFTKLLESFYGPYGYSISFIGIFIGAFWGFIEGFIHFGIFAIIYNWVIAKK
ncbi:MAG TPA: hypothetical protein VF820_00465 [Patescibacteria group bacterium]